MLIEFWPIFQEILRERPFLIPQGILHKQNIFTNISNFCLSLLNFLKENIVKVYVKVNMEDKNFRETRMNIIEIRRFYSRYVSVPFIFYIFCQLV